MSGVGRFEILMGSVLQRHMHLSKYKDGYT